MPFFLAQKPITSPPSLPILVNQRLPYQLPFLQITTVGSLRSSPFHENLQPTPYNFCRWPWGPTRVAQNVLNVRYLPGPELFPSFGPSWWGNWIESPKKLVSDTLFWPLLNMANLLVETSICPRFTRQKINLCQVTYRQKTLSLNLKGHKRLK